jgi:D-alanyl-D-alanine carboxypeptidase (penicillin-binding protein 5/6)
LRDKAIVQAQPVAVSTAAWHAEGSRMFIEPKKAVSVDELLRGMIVQSGQRRVDRIGRSRCGKRGSVRRADEPRGGAPRAREHAFHECDGTVAPQHYSTAADLGRLAAALVRDFPDDYKLYSLREFRYNNITQPNRNRLLWIDPYVDGMKTGHTEAAGWCLIASARRGERRLDRRRAGRRVGCRARRRGAEAPQLRIPGVRPGSALSVGQAGGGPSRVEGSGQRRGGRLRHGQICHAAEGQGGEARAVDDGDGTAAGAGAKGQPVGTVKVALEGAAVGEFPSWRSPTCLRPMCSGRAWDTIRLWFK